MSDKLAFMIHLGRGNISVTSGIVNNIPSLSIEPLTKSLPIGSEVPQELKIDDFPIVLQFHSVESINVWKMQLDRIEKILKEVE